MIYLGKLLPQNPSCYIINIYQFPNKFKNKKRSAVRHVGPEPVGRELWLGHSADRVKPVRALSRKEYLLANGAGAFSTTKFKQYVSLVPALK